MNKVDEHDVLVSVLCPSYNHEKYIRQALDSILMQERTFPIEVLVGEDCSPDNSRAIFQEYQEKYPDLFTMVLRDVNVGGTKNVFDLQTRARGKYLITLETDDYWIDPHKLQKQVDFLESHPEYVGCAHVCQIVNEFSEPSQKYHPENLREGRVIHLDDFLQEGFIFQTATLMYRNFFLDGKDYSIIPKSHNLVFDMTVCSILLHRGDIFLMPDCMTAYRFVVKKGGTSAASLSAAHPAPILVAQMKQLLMLEEYFQGTVNYAPRKQYLVDQYLTGCLRREPEFQWKDMSYMWSGASADAKRNTIRYVLGYPFRRVRKLFLKSEEQST